MKRGLERFAIRHPNITLDQARHKWSLPLPMTLVASLEYSANALI